MTLILQKPRGIHKFYSEIYSICLRIIVCNLIMNSNKPGRSITFLVILLNYILAFESWVLITALSVYVQVTYINKE